MRMIVSSILKLYPRLCLRERERQREGEIWGEDLQNVRVDRIFLGNLVCLQRVYDFFLVGFAAEYSPFYGIEKGAVLQEARVFNDPQLDARRCAQVRQHFLSLHSFVRASTDRFFVFLSVSVFNCNFRVAP